METSDGKGDLHNSGRAGRDAGASRVTASRKTTSRGWYSRGYLPHLDEPGRLQFITFRLHDAVPRDLICAWKEDLHWNERLPEADPRQVELRKRIARYEDKHHGACWLREPRIAQLAEQALFCFDAQRYILISWCVMPNHVHALIETQEGWGLDTILHSWKSFTAQEANKLLCRKGPFWFRDYYDRFIRNETHYINAVTYIEQNPVKAGLIDCEDAWLFSSARRRKSLASD